MRIFACILAILLVSCGREPLVQTKSYVFGTLVDISIYGESDAKAHQAINHVLQNFQQLHHQLHAWKPDSELSQLNQSFAVGNTPVKVTPELSKMLIQASELSRQSDGLFNPALGHLINAWGFQRDEFTPVEINDAERSMPPRISYTAPSLLNESVRRAINVIENATEVLGTISNLLIMPSKNNSVAVLFVVIARAI